MAYNVAANIRPVRVLGAYQEGVNNRLNNDLAQRQQVTQEQNALFNQARASVAGGSKDGLFLAGEGVSWEGGWIDGGLQTGLDASCCTIRLLGGTINA